MLKDYLVRSLDNLEIAPEDYKSILVVQGEPGVQVILKACLSGVLEKEGKLMQEAETPVPDGLKERWIGARNAYYRIADLIMNPPVMEENENE